MTSGITAAKVGTYDDTVAAVNDATSGLAATKAIADQNKADIATINTAITAAAGNYISAGTGVGANLGALDTQVKANADDIAANAIIDTAATSSAGYAATATVKAAVTAIDGALKTAEDDIAAIETDITVTADGNYISAGSDVAANLGALDDQVKTNEDEIAKRTVTVNTTSGVATITDGTNTANVYTKEMADVKFVQTDKNNTFTGNNVFNGTVTMSQGLSITGGTLTAGATTLGATTVDSLSTTGAIQAATLTTTGAATVDSLSVANGATVGGTLAVTGDTTLSGDLHGTTATFTGLVNTAGLNAGSGDIITAGALSGATLNTTGNASVGGDLDVSGDISGDDAVLSGNLTAVDGTFSGDLDVIGDISADEGTFSGEVSAASLTSAGDITATGALNGATLTTTGNASVGGNLAVTGDISGDDAVLSGNLTAVDGTFSGDVSAASVTSAGDITATGALNGATLATTGNASVGGNLAVTGDISGDNAILTGNLTAVDGTFSGNVSAASITSSGDITAAGALNGATLTTTGNANIGGDLAVTGDISGDNATLTGKLTAVDGTFSGDVDIAGDLDVTGDLSADNATVTTLKIGSSAVIDSVDDGSTALTGGNATTLASTATVLKSAENATYTGATVKGASPVPATLKDAISTTTASLNNILTTAGDEVDSNKVDVQWNSTDSTLATVLGNGAYTSTNEIVAGDSVTTALSSLDTAIGNRTITSANSAINTALATDISTAVAKIGDEIGDQAYSNTKTVNYGPIATNTDLTNAVSQVASNIGAAATGSKGNIDGDDSVNENLDALDTAIGDRTAFSTSAAVDYTTAGLNNKDMVTAVSQVASNIGAPIASAQDRTTGKVAATNTVNVNIAALDAAIGADVTEIYNGVATSNAINENIDAINATIGNITELHAGTGSTGDAITNGTGVAATTVVEALNNIDSTIGNIHGLKDTTPLAENSNLAAGTTVENHLVSLDNAIGNRNIASANANINAATAVSTADGLKAAGDAIGDMNFTSTRYASGSQDLSSAVRSLDNNIYRIDREVSDLKHDFKSGMASVAAMSALVPNARSCGDTSLALGTGAYDGHTAMAIGGFHYFNDNLLLNAGVAWGNTSDAVYRMGVTFSW